MKRKMILPAFAAALVLFSAAAAVAGARVGKEAPPHDSPMGPHFSFTRAQWESTLTELPPEIRNAIYADEALFLKEAAALIDAGRAFYAHIDTVVPVDPIDLRPADLVDLNDYPVRTSKPMQVRRPAAEAFAALSQAAAADGIRIVGISGYRTYAYQQRLYENLKNAVGKAGKAVSAAPGHSQHQTGLAMDFNSLEQDFDETPEGLWLKAHAADFGWSLSYPEEYEEMTGYDYEPWHFRYITPAGCRLQRLFFNNIQFYLTDYFHQYDSFYREYRTHE